MDLSPLSNTQPSPKDSGVDVSSPPRREDDPCYGGGGTTPLQTISATIPSLSQSKPRFFGSNRKKNINLAEFQAKELRKIIYDPKERKRKNNVSIMQQNKLQSINTSQNYSIVPMESDKKSNIVLKISSMDHKQLANNRIMKDLTSTYSYKSEKIAESGNNDNDKEMKENLKSKDKKILEIQNIGGLKIKLSLIGSKNEKIKDDVKNKTDKTHNFKQQSIDSNAINYINTSIIKSKKKKVPTATLR